MINKVIAIIPARGGSKGLPGKNIKLLGGKPLILHTLDAASASGVIDQIIVTTDSPEIRETAVNAGYPCPDLRPAELSRDDSMIIDVLKYCLAKLPSAKDEHRHICLLQPTSPFRTSVHISEAIEKYLTGDCDTLVSVVKVPHRFNPRKLMAEKDGYLYQADPEGPLTRNIDTQLWGRNGPAILIMNDMLIRQGRLYGDRIKKYEMDFVSSIDIDDEEDWSLAERLILK